MASRWTIAKIRAEIKESSLGILVELALPAALLIFHFLIAFILWRLY